MVDDNIKTNIGIDKEEISKLSINIVKLTKAMGRGVKKVAKASVSPVIATAKSLKETIAIDKSNLAGIIASKFNPIVGHAVDKLVEKYDLSATRAMSGLFNFTKKAFIELKAQTSKLKDSKFGSKFGSKIKKTFSRINLTRLDRLYKSSSGTLEAIDRLRISTVQTLREIVTRKPKDIPRTPKAAEGGFVKQTGKAIVHKGEIIAPVKSVQLQTTFLKHISEGIDKQNVGVGSKEQLTILRSIDQGVNKQSDLSFRTLKITKENFMKTKQVQISQMGMVGEFIRRARLKYSPMDNTAEAFAVVRLEQIRDILSKGQLRTKTNMGDVLGILKEMSFRQFPAIASSVKLIADVTSFVLGNIWKVMSLPFKLFGGKYRNDIKLTGSPFRDMVTIQMETYVILRKSFDQVTNQLNELIKLAGGKQKKLEGAGTSVVGLLSKAMGKGVGLLKDFAINQVLKAKGLSKEEIKKLKQKPEGPNILKEAIWSRELLEDISEDIYHLSTTISSFLGPLLSITAQQASHTEIIKKKISDIPSFLGPLLSITAQQASHTEIIKKKISGLINLKLLDLVRNTKEIKDLMKARSSDSKYVSDVENMMNAVSEEKAKEKGVYYATGADITKTGPAWLHGGEQVKTGANVKTELFLLQGILITIQKLYEITKQSASENITSIVTQLKSIKIIQSEEQHSSIIDRRYRRKYQNDILEHQRKNKIDWKTILTFFAVAVGGVFAAAGLVFTTIGKILNMSEWKKAFQISPIMNSLRSIRNYLKRFIPIFKDFPKVFEGFIKPFKSIINFLVKISKAIQPLFNVLGRTISIIAKSFTHVGKIFSQIGGFLGRFGNLGKIVTRVFVPLGILINIFNGLLGFFKASSILDKKNVTLGDRLIAGFASFIDGILFLPRWLWNISLGKIFNLKIPPITKWLAKGMAGIASTIDNLFSGVIDWLKSGKVTGFIWFIAESIVDLIKLPYNIITGITDRFNKIYQIYKEKGAWAAAKSLVGLDGKSREKTTTEQLTKIVPESIKEKTTTEQLVKTAKIIKEKEDTGIWAWGKKIFQKVSEPIAVAKQYYGKAVQARSDEAIATVDKLVEGSKKISKTISETGAEQAENTLKSANQVSSTIVSTSSSVTTNAPTTTTNFITNGGAGQIQQTYQGPKQDINVLTGATL